LKSNPLSPHRNAFLISRESKVCELTVIVFPVLFLPWRSAKFEAGQERKRRFCFINVEQLSSAMMTRDAFRHGSSKMDLKGHSGTLAFLG
jgi:hypothetical protein